MRNEIKSIPIVMLLWFLTLGIYPIYWVIHTNNLLNSYLKPAKQTSGGMVILLTIVTFGFYLWYWWYKMGQMEAAAQQKAGVHIGNNSVLYLVLAICQFSFVNVAIMQSQLNEVWLKSEDEVDELDF